MKVAFIVQRCDEDIIGGSETLCLNLAKRLAGHLDIEVITTCARDYVTWKNELPEGLREEAGVSIRRFPVKKERDNRFNRLYSKMQIVGTSGRREQLRWMKYQGPYTPSLLKYLKEHNKDYDLLVFFTYLYYTTFHGITVAPEKSVLIPTAHDEPPIYFNIYDDVFLKPRGIIYLTPEEREFVQGRFHNEAIRNEVIGMGINEVGNSRISNGKELETLKPYILYFGRIEPSKGCDTLFAFFRRYKDTHPGGLNLVLFGDAVMSIPEAKDIVFLGRLNEAEKQNVIRNAEIVVQPSPYESFSINTLEAMLLEVPVVVNGESKVLKGHCGRSRAGLCYSDFVEFTGAITRLLNDKSLRREFGVRGRQYVRAEYNWDTVKDKYIVFLDKTFTDIKGQSITGGEKSS